MGSVKKCSKERTWVNPSSYENGAHSWMRCPAARRRFHQLRPDVLNGPEHPLPLNRHASDSLDWPSAWGQSEVLGSSLNRIHVTECSRCNVFSSGSALIFSGRTSVKVSRFQLSLLDYAQEWCMHRRQLCKMW